MKKENNMKKQQGKYTIELIALVVAVVMLWGWIWNIVKIAGSDVITGMVVLRIVGIFVAPLGSVLGFI